MRNKYVGMVPEKVVAACKELRPNQRNPEDTFGRPTLANAHPMMMVADFGAPAGWPSQSPAKATFTPGLPGEGKASKKKENDPWPTIQIGIRRT